MKDNLLAIAGAVVGGAIGLLAFNWLVQQGLYGLVLPGGLLGIGAGFGRPRAIFIPVLCGVAALILGVVAEWQHFPFIADQSFTYFVAHFYDLQPATLLMIGLGAAIGFWVPFSRLPRKPTQETTP